MSLPIQPADLSAVVAELRENGVAYYAVEGDIEICGSCHGHDIARSGDVNSPCSGANDVPPSEWVALAEAKCETCIGYGQVFASRDIERPELDRWYDCPDCAGGKPKHTLTVECSMCDGEGFLDRIVDDRSFYPSDGPPDCHRCDGSGSVGVDVVVRDVVPVITGSDEYPPDPHIRLQGNRTLLIEDTQRTIGFTPPMIIAPLGPDLAPGMYVAVIEGAS